MELLFIDPQQDLPGVIDKLRFLIQQLKAKLIHFCKQQNLLIVLKMRHFYYNIYYKVRELDIRVSMPLFLGIFMLQ